MWEVYFLFFLYFEGFVYMCKKGHDEPFLPQLNTRQKDFRTSVRAHHTCATVALLPPWTGVTIFHTNCSNVLLVSIGRSEMSYPKISKCPQMSINLPKCPKISNFPFKISKNLPKSQNVLSKIQNVLSKIQNVLSKIPKSNLVDVATTPANQ